MSHDQTTVLAMWMARRGMFKTLGVLIWATLLAVVLTSIFTSEKINATPRSAGQFHHAGKTHH
jgi:hypothetical protein